MLQSCTDPKRGNGATFGRAILDPPNNFHAEIRRGLSAAPSKHLFPFSAVLIYSLLGRKFSARQNSAGSLSTPGTAALRSWRGSAGAREMRAKAAQEPRSAGGARRGGCGSAGECRGLIPGAASSTVSPLCGVCVCVWRADRKAGHTKMGAGTGTGTAGAAQPPLPSARRLRLSALPHSLSQCRVSRSGHDCRSPQIQRNRCLD